MRRILISLLLASAAASPAIAAPHNGSGRQEAQDDRQSAREERQAAREEKQSAREERSQARDESRGNRSNDRSNARQVQQQAQQQQVQQQRGQAFTGGAERYYARPDRGNGNRIVTPADMQQRQQARQDARELRQSNRPTPNVVHNRQPPVVSNTPRPGTQPPLRAEGYRGHQQSHWNTSWRNNNRYNWHDYRNRHRSHFHLGFYFDPYGWGYQPFSIGWRLWPSYYSNRYWINDPWSYRLPYAPPGYVWVRYWNDAVLVDTWTGTVVDMIPGFFW
jgi:hypothetical protein